MKRPRNSKGKARSALAALISLLASACAPTVSTAQSSVLQGGAWTPGHAPMYSYPPAGQPIVIDSGPAGGGVSGIGLSELNITTRGTGSAPFAGGGTGIFGTHACMNDGPNTGPYHFLCFDANASGGGMIAYGAVNGAPVLPLQMNVNGANYQFPFVATGVVGPVSSTINDLACWNNTAGTLLKDCTQVPAGTTVATSPGLSDNSTKVATTAYAQPRSGCTPIETFGGGTGVGDNTAALQAFYTSLGSGQTQGCIGFGAGRYTFSQNAIAYTMASGQSIAIQGAGPEQTQLYFSNSGDGLQFTYTSVGSAFVNGNALAVRDVAFVTAAAGGGNAVTVNGASNSGNPMKPTIFTRVYLRGSGTSNYWTTGLKFNDTQNVYVTDSSFYGANQSLTSGIGIQYNATGGGQPTVLIVQNFFVTFANIGVDAEGYWQGVAINQSNFNAVSTGVKCNATVAEPQCSVANTAIEAEVIGVQWNNVVGSSLSGNLIYAGQSGLSNNVPAIQITGSSGEDSITGNSIVCLSHGGNTAQGIHYETGAAYIATVGNNLQGCSTALNYDAGSTKNFDDGNVLLNYSTAVTDSGTANSHHYTDNAGGQQQSLTTFSNGIGGVAWSFGTDSNGALSLGANGKQPYINFQCGASGFCQRLQSISSTTIGFLNAGGAGDTFVVADGTSGGTPATWISVTANATGVAPVITATGTDSNVNMQLACKGTCGVSVLAPLLPGAYNVGALPTCNSTYKGSRATVLDANSAYTYLSTITTGGGSNVLPAFCNGTNWVSG